MSKDYYKILGVEKNSSKEDIKKAYKKLAKEYHPDLNKDKPEAEAKFKEINEAASVLTDDQKRSQYDQHGSESFKSGGFNSSNFGGGFEGFDFNDIFESMFNGGFSGHSRRGPRRGADLRYDIEITLEEVAKGTEKTIKLKKEDKCKTCDGAGGTGLKTCSTCHGKGRVIHQKRTPFGMFQTQTMCDDCNGQGQTYEKECHDCDGLGHILTTKTLTVKIPKGIEEETKLRMVGEGEPGDPRAPFGDLYVFVHIKEHDVFQRDGNDIYIEVPISFKEAVMGATIEVPTITGKADLKVPDGTKPETLLRMKGKGLPHMKSDFFGDQYVKITIDVPQKITKKQKELLEQFDKESKEKHPHKKIFEKIKNVFK
jgi:molecular chaperone DnaJ